MQIYIFSYQSSKTDPDDLVDIVCRMQNTRFDDQRCNIKTTDELSNNDALEKHGMMSLFYYYLKDD